MINVKTISATVVGAVAVGLSVGSAAPAQALSFSFSQGSAVNPISVQGTFAGVDSNSDGIIDLSELTDYSASFDGGGLVTSFTTGLSLLTNFSYNLSSQAFLVLTGTQSIFQISNLPSGTGVYNYNSAGVGSFGTTGNVVYNGSIGGFEAGLEGSLTLTPNATPIPTPALLPGLLGLGAAALRKRKSEASETEAEPVEA